MHNIHISDIRAFRSCRRRWDWQSGMRNNLEPAVPYAPFFVGRAVHYCLEMYYSEQIPVWDSLDKYLENEEKIAGHMWSKEQEQWDESVQLISELLHHYILWTQVDPSDFRDENLDFIDMEIPFNVPMYHPETGEESDQIRLEGRFDGIVMHKPTGSFWIWEAKTARSIGELVKSLENDEQAGAYIYAAQSLKDVPIKGILYNIMRKKAPVHPRELQNGFLSTQKGDYTPFSYVADVKKHHPDWTWDMIQQQYGSVFMNTPLGDNGFFLRYPVRRSEYEVKHLMENIYWTAMEMIDPKTVIYPSPNFVQCNFCAFRAPCMAKSRGTDYKALLAAEYQPRVKAESFREVEL
jgi:hypothetical protein